jgi:uncharacterized membrane protein YphA (DoxX/SURF4 family)
MHLGRLLLRLAIGGTFIVHGTQKLFGWFGGYGPERGPVSSSSRSAYGRGGATP